MVEFMVGALIVPPVVVGVFITGLVKVVLVKVFTAVEIQDNIPDSVIFCVELTPTFTIGSKSPEDGELSVVSALIF